MYDTNQSPLDNELLRGEKLLWSGTSKGKNLFSAGQLFLSFLGFLLLPPLILATYDLLSHHEYGPAFICLFFAGIAFYFFAGRFLLRLFFGSRLHYGVTSYRVLILSTSSPKLLWSLNLRQLPALEIKNPSGETGDIDFGFLQQAKSKNRTWTIPHPALRFNKAQQPQEVLDSIRKAAQADVAAHLAMFHFAPPKTLTSTGTPFIMDEGEHLRWLGKPGPKLRWSIGDVIILLLGFAFTIFGSLILLTALSTLNIFIILLTGILPTIGICLLLQLFKWNPARLRATSYAISDRRALLHCDYGKEKREAILLREIPICVMQEWKDGSGHLKITVNRPDKMRVVHFYEPDLMFENLESVREAQDALLNNALVYPHAKHEDGTNHPH